MEGGELTLSNSERVGRALDSLKVGLGPFVERKFRERYPGRAEEELRQTLYDLPLYARDPFQDMDVAALLKVMTIPHVWDEVFRSELEGAGRLTGRSLVNELRDVRNRWGHQGKFSTDDTHRALDSVYRLLALVKSPQADAVKKMRDRLRGLPVPSPQPPVVHTDDDPLNAGQRYRVYTDLTTKYSMIHRESGWCYRKRKRTLLPDNYWHGPYASKEQARSSSKTVGQVRECGNCRP